MLFLLNFHEHFIFCVRKHLLLRFYVQFINLCFFLICLDVFKHPGKHTSPFCLLVTPTFPPLFMRQLKMCMGKQTDGNALYGIRFVAPPLSVAIWKSCPTTQCIDQFVSIPRLLAYCLECDGLNQQHTEIFTNLNVTLILPVYITSPFYLKFKN